MRPVTLILALALLPGCRGCSKQMTDSTPVSDESLFAEEFVFRCSPDRHVECSGVFDVRAESPGEAAPISGQDALAVRLQSLRDAKESIRIQALIFRADESGLYISELLKQRKKDGLDVRVIVDAVSNMDWKTQWMYFDLKRHGIEVEGYEALYLEWLTAEKLLKPWHANKRFHDKMWVIDGETAIVGGLNIANEYFRVDPTPINKWHDQDVMLRGPIVADITTAFDRNYEFFKAIKAKLPKILNPDNAWKLSSKTMGQINDVDIPFWPKAELSAAVEACVSRKVALEFKPAALRFLQSRPRLNETFIAQSYINQIDRAQKSILIANAYFIPSRPMVDALLRASARGVEVVVLTNSPSSNDIAEIATVSRYVFKDLMTEDGSGIQIHEWIGPEADEGTLHAKYALFDGRSAIIGSFNLDPRSERLNSETAIAIEDEALVGRLESGFRQDLLPKATRVQWSDAVAYKRPEGVDKTFKLLYAMPFKAWL